MKKYKIIKTLLISFTIIFIAILFGVIKNYKENLNSEKIITDNTEVVILGAGPSGIAAAIHLARNNHKVMLIEQTDWVGGQMTAAAVPTLDEGYLLGEDPAIFGEFMGRVTKKYGNKPINVCYWGLRSRCFEPSVGRKVFEEMLSEEKNITILYRTTVSTIYKNENNISAIKTTSAVKKNNDLYVPTKIIIDASELGYSLPLLDADYRLGNNTNTTTGKNSCIQSITYPVVIREYFDGVPSQLKFKEGNPPGGQKSYDYAKKFLFEPSLKKDGNPWLVNGKVKTPYDFNLFKGFRAVPDSNKSATNYTADDFYYADKVADYSKKISKTILNMTNDIAVGYEYLENSSVRKQDDCRAKLRSLQNIYYIQVDLGEKSWSIANDEGYDTKYNIEENKCENIKEFSDFEKYMPVMPYVRESYRLIGDYTLTGKDILPEVEGSVHVAKNKFLSSVAVNDYSNDLHGCNKEDTIENDLESISDKGDARRIFQIPFESFVTSKIGGLIVAEKNISASRLASSALRTQPSVMQIGLAAGAIADIAINQNKLPSEISYKDVQKEILTSGGRIDIIKK